MRRSIRISMAIGLVAAGQIVSAAETPSSGDGAGVNLPQVDVVEGVRRMLEQAPRTTEAVTPPPPVVTSTPQSQPSASASPGGPAAMPQRPAASPVPPTAPAQTSVHVPVPEKEITIRSLQDVQGLMLELEKAQRRQQEK